MLGSRSTYLPAAFGGLRGRALVPGSELPLTAAAAALAETRFAHLSQRGRTTTIGPDRAASVPWSAPPLTLLATEPLVVRAVDGVHAELFDKASAPCLLQRALVGGSRTRTAWAIV